MGYKKTYLVFNSTRKAILAERFCREQNLDCITVPVPREFSAKCGIALELDSEYFPEAEKVLSEKDYDYEVFEI